MWIPYPSFLCRRRRWATGLIEQNVNVQEKKTANQVDQSDWWRKKFDKSDWKKSERIKIGSRCKNEDVLWSESKVWSDASTKHNKELELWEKDEERKCIALLLTALKSSSLNRQSRTKNRVCRPLTIFLVIEKDHNKSMKTTKNQKVQTNHTILKPKHERCGCELSKWKRLRKERMGEADEEKSPDTDMEVKEDEKASTDDDDGDHNWLFLEEKVVVLMFGCAYWARKKRVTAVGTQSW